MKTLHKVEITRIIYVLAENKQKAEREAIWNEKDEEPVSVYVSEVKAKDAVDEEWLTCYPYGDDNCNSTVAQILEKLV
jgi:hypothetical protein